MKTCSILIIFLFITSVGRTQTATLVGQEAAPVVFQHSLGKQVKPDFYKNKILVLDFWATWCAPCIANFPHFNKLTTTYQSKDVVFAIISDEPLKTVNKFFERSKKQIQSLNLIDTGGKTGDAFKVNSIPYSIVIDKDNIVRWEGSGSDLTSEILSAIINKQALPAEKVIEAVKVEAVVLPKVSKASAPMFSFMVGATKKESTGGSARTSKTGDFIGISRSDYPLGNVLEYLTGYSSTVRFICNDTAKLSQHIDLDFSSRADTTLFKKYSGKLIPGFPRKNMIIELMGDVLKFNSKIVKENKKYYELVVTDSAKLHSFGSLQEGHSSFSSDYFPRFEIVGYNLKDIAVNLQSSAKIIIETSVIDIRHYDLSLDITDISSLQKTLNFHGLALKEKSGEIEMLAITFY